MLKPHFPARALTAALLSSSLCFAAQADTLVDIYELALENDAQLKTQIAQYNADIELEKLEAIELPPAEETGEENSEQRMPLEVVRSDND